MQFISGNIKTVDDAIITPPQSKTCASDQAVMMKSIESKTHFIHLSLNALPYSPWQLQEIRVKTRIVDLRSRPHSPLSDPRTDALFHFVFRLADLSFELGRKFKFVLYEVIHIIAHPAHVFDRQLSNVCLDLFDRSHTPNDVARTAFSQVDSFTSA
jgi:hypothetical protein